MFGVNRQEWDPYGLLKDRSAKQEDRIGVERRDQLVQCTKKLGEIHAWRRGLDMRYHGSSETEAALDAFSDTFLTVADTFDPTSSPARSFLRRRRREVVAMKERFRLSPRILGNSHAYVARAWEENETGFSEVDTLVGDCHLDAPFGYAFEFKNNQGTWDVIALAAALPDFSTNTLLVKQIQGGGGVRDISVEAAEARSKFNIAACIPFLAMAQLARASGLSKIKVAKDSLWKQSKLKKSDDSPNEQVRARFHMEEGAKTDPYYSGETEMLLKE